MVWVSLGDFVILQDRIGQPWKITRSLTFLYTPNASLISFLTVLLILAAFPASDPAG